jgi:H/ACA ribonucleoprotein complex non-core subunit NAF1
MQAAGDEDGGPGISGPLRTANEKPEEVLPKPNIVITPEMKITELGEVENIVDNFALIRASTSGDYMVLETGSALCLHDRTLIGVVQETLGRVQEPLYMVGFKTAEEIKEASITKGTKVFYVDDHSTYVFTQALRALKGTDASNMHDEELAGDEVEFSDDEQEREYKKRMKEAKYDRREARNGDVPGAQRSNGIAQTSIQQTAFPTSIKYDDDDDDDEDMYKPLARPDNLSELMAYGAPIERPNQQSHFRGGRGRGRGDRQWVDRGRGNRSRGGRGRPFSNQNDNDSQRAGQSNSPRRSAFDSNRSQHRGNDRRNPQPPAQSDQGASFGQNGAVQPSVQSPTAQVFSQSGQQNMPMPPMPMAGAAVSNSANGTDYNQFAANFQNAFSAFQQQFAQMSRQFQQQQPQAAQPFPQWQQAPQYPPAVSNGWTGAQSQQHDSSPPDPRPQGRQGSPSNTQLEELLRAINSGSNGHPS